MWNAYFKLFMYLFFPLIPSYILQMYVAWDLQLFIDICDDMFNIQPWQIQPKPVLFSQLTVNELLIKWFYYKCTKQTGKIRRKKNRQLRAYDKKKRLLEILLSWTNFFTVYYVYLISINSSYLSLQVYKTFYVILKHFKAFGNFKK